LWTCRERVATAASLRVHQSVALAHPLAIAALIYLDKPEHGGFAAYEDGFTLLELCRKYYRDAGLDARQLDLLIR